MIVEKGPRLVPATAADAERLETWRIGTRVNVAFLRNGSRVMERKWWAVLGLVVDRCNVPWTTKEQASEAIKLALDIVHMTKTVGGAWMLYPKSLTELTEAELDDAVVRMMDLITKMTGVDPETLRKESADVGPDEQSDQPDGPQAHDPADSSEVDSNSDLAASTPESAAADPSPEEAGPPPPASSGDDISALHQFAKRLIAVIGDETSFVLEESARLVKELGITADADVDRARSAAKYAARSCGDYAKSDKIQKKTAVRFIAGVVGVEEKDLTV